LNPPTSLPLAKFQVLDCIGEGSQSWVHRAQHTETGEMAALKVFKLDGRSGCDAQGWEAAEREFQALARVQHSSVARVYDFGRVPWMVGGEETQRPYLLMEWLSGRPLSHWVHPDRRLPFDTVLALLIDLARSLDLIHQAGILHRDIKPDNVRYDPARGRAAWMDFGVARLFDASRTQTGVLFGTPDHMAPEIIQGDRATVRSDVYALGVLAYELLCARPPHEGGSWAALMREVVRQPAAPVLSRNPQVPRRLAFSVDRALSFQAEHRWESPGVWAEYLLSIV
jgi:serine/threonine protein kinase